MRSRIITILFTKEVIAKFYCVYNSMESMTQDVSCADMIVWTNGDV